MQTEFPRSGMHEGWGGGVINAFSSNLSTVNLKMFPNHGGIFACRLIPNHSIELWIVKRFQRPYHVQFPSFDPDLRY